MLKADLKGKQKRFLRALGSKLDPVVQIGKAGLTPAVVISANEAIAARELIKVKVLQNCLEEPQDIFEVLAERTDAELVQKIGRNGLLYRPDEKEPKIVLPE